MSWDDYFAGFDNFGAPAFDPWPVAYAMERLRSSPDDAIYLQLWRQLYAEQQQAQEQWKGSSARSPDSQAMAAAWCLELKPAIAAGSGGALLEAVARCAASGAPMPAWIALPFVERYWGGVAGTYKGWEDAFGPIRGTVKAREAKSMGLSTYRAALQLIEEEPGKALNSAFYAEVGVLVGREKSAAQEILRDYIKDNDAAPLLFLKRHIAAGGTLGSAQAAWFQEKTARWVKHAESR